MPNVSTTLSGPIPLYMTLNPSVCSKKFASGDDDESLIVDFPTRPRSSSLKEVSFSETSTLHTWVDIHASSSNSWYNKLEYKAFRRNLNYDVAVARSQCGRAVESSVSTKDVDKNNHEACLTGIEHFVCQQTLELVKEIRLLHRLAILEEQNRQVECGAPNPHALRAVSRPISKYSKTRAWVQAGGKITRRGPVSPAA